MSAEPISEVPDGDVEVIELVIPPRPDVVSVARLVVGAAVAMDPAFDEERSADLRLAASEACTNAIEAQLSRRSVDAAARSIVLRCTLGRERIVMTVQDHGGGFDPDLLEEHPAVTDPARLDHEDGLGIPLIRLLSDELEFRDTPGGTTVVMTFGPRPTSGRIGS
jgi:anti-sigma regulatory factor (Ser/Thr protein kinase)